ncbi:FAD binding domain-containing protein [Amycolatopsis methanolica]|uniref:Molybdopterin dehydrogenase FAD-binding protein n=1 Tax=Amycolatopsis methanolica 239 TaxID=1068978 RepID=A0A076MM23_AMYME|nr:FAD binding domain-containing protein [Amycolatopsis methanolica]AIJ21903.1 molybdopterin dehydrogenase FAD-binding protein [Amycolatopsis methanolica 239]
MRVHRPESLDEATALLNDLDDAMVYGGGTAIQILRKQGLLFVEDYVDIARVPGLGELMVTSDVLSIGTLTPLRRVETDPRVRAFAPLASETYGQAANPRVRNTASAGGNIAHGDYRLDPPTALLVLDATVHLASSSGTREVSVREFFTDFQETAVEHGELITAITVPRPPAGSRGAFEKMRSLSENDWPCASAAVLAVPEEGFVEIRIGLGALAPTSVYLAFDQTPDMTVQQAVDAAIDIANSAMDPIADVRGSAAYKAHLGRIAVEEAVRRCLKELARD